MILRAVLATADAHPGRQELQIRLASCHILRVLAGLMRSVPMFAKRRLQQVTGGGDGDGGVGCSLSGRADTDEKARLRQQGRSRDCGESRGGGPIRGSEGSAAVHRISARSEQQPHTFLLRKSPLVLRQAEPSHAMPCAPTPALYHRRRRVWRRLSHRQRMPCDFFPPILTRPATRARPEAFRSLAIT